MIRIAYDHQRCLLRHHAWKPCCPATMRSCNQLDCSGVKNRSWLLRRMDPPLTCLQFSSSSRMSSSFLPEVALNSDSWDVSMLWQGGSGGVATENRVQLIVETAYLWGRIRMTVHLPCLLVRLPKFFDFHVALLHVPGVALLPHVPCNLFVDVYVSSAGLELCLYRLFSTQTSKIHHLLCASCWSTFGVLTLHGQLCWRALHIDQTGK